MSYDSNMTVSQTFSRDCGNATYNYQWNWSGEGNFNAAEYDCHWTSGVQNNAAWHTPQYSTQQWSYPVNKRYAEAQGRKLFVLRKIFIFMFTYLLIIDVNLNFTMHYNLRMYCHASIFPEF